MRSRNSKNRQDREDLQQEITLQLWKSFPSFKGKSAFSTWMYRVALNTAINQTRRPGLFIDASSSPEIPCDPSDSYRLSEEIQILYRAISGLKKVEKAIILMWLEEKSYEEIAEAIGITVKNVSVRLVRIRTKLAEIISKLQ
ncbi:MAG: RNA polymerase sigma factor [Bacteroidales bacterium]|nr:RNA polymerase sigma factor [Bacteroidales bacterium]